MLRARRLRRMPYALAALALLLGAAAASSGCAAVTGASWLPDAGDPSRADGATCSAVRVCTDGMCMGTGSAYFWDGRRCVRVVSMCQCHGDCAAAAATVAECEAAHAACSASTPVRCDSSSATCPAGTTCTTTNAGSVCVPDVVPLPCLADGTAQPLPSS